MASLPDDADYEWAFFATLDPDPRPPPPRGLLTPAERALADVDTSTPYSVLLPDDGTDVYF